MAAGLTRSYPYKIQEEPLAKQLLLLKHYADNHPSHDTAKAWHDLESGINVYDVGALSGNRASLVLPKCVELSYDQSGCAEVPVGYEGLYHQAIEHVVAQLGLDKKHGDHWQVHKGEDNALTVVNTKNLSPTAGGGAPAGPAGGASAGGHAS